MIEFEKTPNLVEIIEAEKRKHMKPPFYSGEFDMQALKEHCNTVSDEIKRVADELEKDSELYLICEMAQKWVQENGQKVLYQTKIPLNPRSKKNNQKIVYNKAMHQQIIVQGDIYKQFEKDCGWFIKPPQMPISGPVNIKVLFYRENAKRCDLTNLLEAIDDILVKYKVIADDNFNILAAHDGSRVFVDREDPRIEITITSMEVQNYGR